MVLLCCCSFQCNHVSTELSEMSSASSSLMMNFLTKVSNTSYEPTFSKTPVVKKENDDHKEFEKELAIQTGTDMKI